MSQRFRLLIEYDGRPYMGWQRQAHGPSVQEALERAILAITGEDVLVHGAGRTDTGVHALGMTAHVDIAKTITPFRLMEAMNARLRQAGERVAVLAADPAPEDFHARFSCIRRHYEYRLICRRAPPTWEQGLVWQRSKTPDLATMQEAAAHLIGHHDFTAFRSAHCQSPSAMRTLDQLDIEQQGNRFTFRISARSFLHHQIRFMVGALVLTGDGRYQPHHVRQALESGSLDGVRLNVPAHGLWFIQADYSDNSMR